MSRESLGELGQQVLLVLLHLGSESYAVPLAEELQRRTGRKVSSTGMYVVLRRLEKRGYLESWMDEGTSERGGRPRRMFRIQEEALEPLRESREALLTLWQGLEPYLEES